MNKLTFNDQDIEIAVVLDKLQIKYDVVYCGEQSRGNWTFDLWCVAFSKSGKTFSMDYKTGIGHRVEKLPVDYKAYKNLVKQYRIKCGDKGAIVPTQASVIYCLLSDTYFAELSHCDFCQELGIDEDSRKGLEDYLFMQKQHKEFITFFDSKIRQEFEQVLEDY